MRWENLTRTETTCRQYQVKKEASTLSEYGSPGKNSQKEMELRELNRVSSDLQRRMGWQNNRQEDYCTLSEAGRHVDSPTHSYPWPYSNSHSHIFSFPWIPHTYNLVGAVISYQQREVKWDPKWLQHREEWGAVRKHYTCWHISTISTLSLTNASSSKNFFFSHEVNYKDSCQAYRDSWVSQT